MTPARVLHVLATAHEHGASIGRMVRTLAQALDPGRFCVAAWFLGGEGPLAKEFATAGIAVRTFDWSGDRHEVVGASGFWRGLRREPFSIVHLHFGGRAAPFLVRSAVRTKIVLHLHYNGAEAGRTGPIRIRPWMADQVVALSRAVAGDVIGVTPRVVYYGIRIPQHSGRGVTQRHNSPQSAVLGVASRLVPVKGIVYLIRALALLRQEFPAVRLEIAGAGPEQAGLQQEARALDLCDAVAFVGWQADIWPWLARWDIFVQPSLAEGFGMAALEAMAAGLPVVGTSAGGLPELIEDGCSGYVVPPGDATALAARLRELLLNADRRSAMGAAGQARVRERFSAERMAAELSGIYDALLDRNGARQRD
ncbi:MAG TPA: glycosyltransferase family 4 protein [Vicinamibacterales bacterium]